MTRQELSTLFQAVKRTRGACLPRGQALQAFLDAHPGARREEVRAASLAFDRAPFPSVDGNPPVDRDRPYFDARFWARVYAESMVADAFDKPLDPVKYVARDFSRTPRREEPTPEG